MQSTPHPRAKRPGRLSVQGPVPVVDVVLVVEVVVGVVVVLAVEVLPVEGVVTACGARGLVPLVLTVATLPLPLTPASWTRWSSTTLLL
jgi:hypothetical protein